MICSVIGNVYAGILLNMAFRSVVKSADAKRRSTVKLQEGALKNLPKEQSDPSAVQLASESVGEGWSVSATIAGASGQHLDGQGSSACKSSPTRSLTVNSSKRSRNRNLNYRVLEEARTYKWAEARLSKSAALASANWDHPEVYIDYIQSLHESMSPEQKRRASRVARPAVPRNDIAVPENLPPHLEQPDFSDRLQFIDTHKTQLSTVDSRVQSVQSLPTEEVVLAPESHTLDRAVAMKATSATTPGRQCIDAGSPGPSKPISAWADQPEAPMGDGEKPPAKCNCVLM